MRRPDEVRALIGRRLAKLLADGLSKADCVRRVFPKMSETSARTNSTTIFRRYEVVKYLLELFPQDLGKQNCEALINYLIDKALTKGDDYMILQIVDRIAKIQGKYSEKIQIEARNLDEEDARLREAESVLKRAGIDPSRVNLN